MHDWKLKKIDFDWSAARVTVELEDSTYTPKLLIAESVRQLHVPRANDWGPSVSVNEVSEFPDAATGLHRLKIEMQSGDVLEIIAGHFSLPS